MILISGFRLRNFEIRIGNDTEFKNNRICHKQMESVGDGLTKSFPCNETLCGSWISVNKSESISNSVHLHLLEVRVLACEYNINQEIIICIMVCYDMPHNVMLNCVIMLYGDILSFMLHSHIAGFIQ